MIRSVGVVVPAANEETLIGSCLDALAAARAHAIRRLAQPLNVRIVVVLDGCVDGTAEVVASRPRVEAVSCVAGGVGAARAAGARHLLASAAWPLRETWLANTDADSRVPVDWISTMVADAARGADVVLGTVLPGGDLAASVRHRWFGRHLLREDHPHVHGANFGIRADVYAALGGWPLLATGEDVALAARADTAGHLRIVRTAAIPVLTSPRRCGRAPQGFAQYLDDLHADDQVEPTARPA
jgi:glycosyltransferase involved in cell wall biosynthesis